MPEPAVPAEPPEEESRSGIGRGLAMTGMLVIFLAAPVADAVHHRDGTARPVTLILAVLAFLGLFGNLVLTRDRDLRAGPVPWRRIGAITAVGVLLPVLGGVHWLTVTGIVGACFAAYLPRVPATVGVLAAARGHGTVADIAAQLHLSQGTVRNHLSAAIRKLGARTRAEALALAEQKGWL